MRAGLAELDKAATDRGYPSSAAPSVVMPERFREMAEAVIAKMSDRDIRRLCLATDEMLVEAFAERARAGIAGTLN